MASESVRKLSSSQQSDIVNFLQSTKIHTIGSYTLGKTIGEGSFGKVKLAKHNLTGVQVAIKIVEKIYAPQLVREIETWRQLRHPNIAQLYEVLTSESKIYMVTEYCQGGEMLEFIQQNGRLDDTSDRTKKLFLQITNAVACCHEKNFIHRDLKLENILMTNTFNAKLIDFGFTRWADENTLLDTYCGSSAYCAPEIVAGQRYSGACSDVWSLGVVLYTIVVGCLPFDADNDEETHKQIKDINYSVPDFIGDDVADLISKILRKNPTERPSIDQILEHPWLLSISDRGADEKRPLTVGASKLGKSSDEMALAAKLEACGFNVSDILKSVHMNACDQSSALWHLLLEQNHNLGTPVNAKSFEINLTDVGDIFETTLQNQPASESKNPLLHLASFSTAQPSAKISNTEIMSTKDANLPKLVSSRRKFKGKEPSTPDQINPRRRELSVIKVGIVEEEEVDHAQGAWET